MTDQPSVPARGHRVVIAAALGGAVLLAAGLVAVALATAPSGKPASISSPAGTASTPADPGGHGRSPDASPSATPPAPSPAPSQSSGVRPPAPLSVTAAERVLRDCYGTGNGSISQVKDVEITATLQGGRIASARVHHFHGATAMSVSGQTATLRFTTIGGPWHVTVTATDGRQAQSPQYGQGTCPQ